MTRALLGLLMLLVPGLAAQNYAALDKVFLDDALTRGDLDAHAATLLSVIEADPAAPESWLALRAAMRLRPDLAAPRVLYDALGRLAADDFARCGRNADAFAEAWLDLARDFDNDPAWHAVARRWGAVTTAAWIGPFAEAGPAAHDEAFGPEVLADFSRTWQGAYGTVAWQASRDPVAPGGGIELSRQTRWSGYCYYVAISVICSADTPAVILPRFNGPGKLWLNGALVADIDRRARDYPQLCLEVSLPRGRNLLLFKLSTVSDLAVRLRGPAGRPLQGVVCEAPTAQTPGVAAVGGPALHSGLDLAPWINLGSNVPAQPRKRALLHMAMALALSENSLDLRAGLALAQALVELPDEPLVQLACHKMAEDSPLYGSGERRRAQARLLDTMLAAHARFLPALLARARTLANDERFHEAIDMLQADAAGNWRMQLALADVFQRAGWKAQWLTALRAAQTMAPDAVPVLRALSRYWSWQGMTAAQLEIDRAITALVPADRNAVASQVGCLLRMAQPEEALKLARAQAQIEPGNDYIDDRLATTLLACGKLADACAVYERMAARSPQPEEVLEQAAKACLQAGDDARAASLLHRALAQAPSAHSARRQLQRLNGQDADFFKPWMLPPQETAALDATSAQFPRADSALLLDEMVQVVYADGGSISFVRQIRKILTQQGVDDRGKDDVPGELLLARTIQPDGTVLEPITFSGSQLEFPGMAVGCSIEVAWLVRNQANPWHTLAGDRFFFSDQNLTEPFVCSRYVLVTPAEMNLGIQTHNMRAQDFTRRDDGANTVRIWDVRRPQHPEREAFAPSALEFLPWLEINQARDWHRKLRQTAEHGLAAGRGITPRVQAKAQEICHGAETDEQKARRVYAWVNENLTTRGDAANPHQSLQTLTGDREELFLALCAAAGVPLGFAAADYAPQWRPTPADDLPDLHWAYLRDDDFNLFLAVVQGDNGDPIYLDLSNRLAPFGALPSRRGAAPVLLWRQGHVDIGHLPDISPDLDRFENQAGITLDAKGGARVQGWIALHGDKSWQLKDSLRTQTQNEMQQNLEEELAGSFAGLDLETCASPDIDRVGTPYLRTYEGKSTGLARKQGNGLSLGLPLESMSELLSALVGRESRTRAISLKFSFVQSDSLQVAPPPGWRFRSIPADLVYATDPLTYALTFELKDGDLLVRRKVRVGPGRIEPVGYAQLTEQVKRIGQAEKTRVELEPAE